MHEKLLWTRPLVGMACTAGLAVLVGCASSPPRASAPRSAGGDEAVLATAGRDGAEAHPPPGLEQVPDAQPRVEAVRSGGPNKPYEVFGVSYVPWTQDRPHQERGLASWYGRKFHGRRTSSGEPYDMYAMTAAHPTLPIPSYVRVRNPANGREVIVRVNDRGPFHRGRIIDLSYTAALRLGVLRAVAPVEIERITFGEIRAGTWPRAPEAVERGVAMTAPADTDRTLAMHGDAAETRIGSGVAAVALSQRDSPGSTAVAIPAAVSAPISSAAAALISSAAAAPIPSAAAAPLAPSAAPLASSAAPLASSPAPLTSSPAALTSSATAVDHEPARAGDVGGVVPAAPPVPGFWVQLGAFRRLDAAAAFQRRVAAELEWLSPLLAVFGEDALFRLQAGPYASQDDARGAAASIRAALRLVPLIVDRRR